MVSHTFPGIAPIVIQAGQSVDVTDRAARLLGTPASFANDAQLLSKAGNVGIAFTSGQVWRIKSAFTTNAATGSNRQLTSAGLTVSSKTVAPSATGPLLDTELTIKGTGGTTDLALGNGIAADTWTVTAERIV
jgi:hypothetical protein